ncbi:MAG: hypothetical protein HGB06_02890 [Chlorobaculum sp.]|jgi:hypothetical protein|nr:hypothetical protein [Chlorobaculum sp.]
MSSTTNYQATYCHCEERSDVAIQKKSLNRATNGSPRPDLSGLAMTVA